MRQAPRIAAFFCLAGLITAAASGQQAPYRLTIEDAIQKGLQANLGVLMAGTRVEEAEGARTRSFSAALLPRVSRGKVTGSCARRNAPRRTSVAYSSCGKPTWSRQTDQMARKFPGTAIHVPTKTDRR